MRRLIALLLVTFSLAVPATVFTASPASAASCSFSQSADGHKLYATCARNGDSGNQYKVIAKFCNQGSCVNQGSSWAAWGKSVTITSGGYFSGLVRVDTRTVTNA